MGNRAGHPVSFAVEGIVDQAVVLKLLKESGGGAVPASRTFATGAATSTKHLTAETRGRSDPFAAISGPFQPRLSALKPLILPGKKPSEKSLPAAGASRTRVFVPSP